jgi:hypothetical protein
MCSCERSIFARALNSDGCTRYLPRMAENEQQPTQKTRPKKGEPMEIPVPTREDFMRDLKKVAPPVPTPKPSEDERS